MKLFKSLSITLLALLLTAGSAFAQTALTTTTFSAAVADTSSTGVSITSTTGITAPGTGANLTYLWADWELMQVRTVNTTTSTLSVIRGASGTRASPHNTNTLVYVIPALAAQTNLTTVDQSGTCTASTYQYLPIINIRNGNIWNCLITTSGNIWQGGSLVPVRELNPRAVTAAAAYTMLPTDTIVSLSTILGTGAAAKSVVLPSHVGLAGKIIYIVDESGGISGTTSIILVGTINGTNSSVATVVQLKTAFQAVSLMAGSGGWFLLSCNTATSAVSGALASCR